MMRLEIKLKHPNPMFEKWILCWLEQARRRNSKAEIKLQEALCALRKYPLPLLSGRECMILRGFGNTLCNLIDEELQILKCSKVLENNTNTYEQEIQKVVKTITKNTNQNVKSRMAINVERKLKDSEDHVTMHPGSFQIILLVDTQETNGKNKKLLDETRIHLEAFKIAYEIRKLTIGDFVWIARDEYGNELVLPYIIERKRMDDLAASIRDGRFHEQKHRMRQCGVVYIYYLLEDYDNERLGLPLDSLYQAITNTQIQSDFSIIHTENHWKSIVYLHCMTLNLIQRFKTKVLVSTDKAKVCNFNQHDQIVGLLKFRAFYNDSSRNAKLSVRELFVQQMLQLHSLSLEKALAIVSIYQTPRILLNAIDGCARDIEARLLLSDVCCGHLQRRVGEKISQTIYEFYKTNF